MSPDPARHTERPAVAEDAPRAAWFDALPDAVAIVGAEGRRLREVNAALSHLTGRPREAWLGRPVAELGVGAGGRALERLCDLAAGGEGATDEVSVARADGGPVAVEAVAAAAGAGTVIIALRDLSRRRDVEAEIQSLYREFALLHLIRDRIGALVEPAAIAEQVLEALLKILSRELGGAVYLVEPDGGRLALAARRRLPAATMAAFEPLAAPGGRFAQALTAGRAARVDDPRTLAPPLAAAMAEAGARGLLVVPLRFHDRAHGLLVLVGYDAAPFSELDADLLTAVAGETGIVLENARLHERVRRSEERYRAMVEGSPLGFLEVAADGTILAANAAAHRLLDLPPPALVGQTVTSWYVDPAERARLLAAMGPDGVVREQALEWRRPDGAPLWVSVTARRVPAGPGRPARTEEAIRDITGERELQQKLLQTEKLASLGQMISGIAHELNNPLTGVLGYAQLLQEMECPPAFRDDLAKINADALRCKRIIENLMRFARKEKPQRIVVNVNEEIETVLELRRYQLTVGNIEVVRELDRALPMTLADDHQLQQVFLNLINNAADAMQEHRGRGTLTVRTTHGGGRIRATVADDGPGIAPEVLPRVFDPFFTTKEVGKGTGLGLSVSYGIVHEHGGELLATSEPGHGAAFTVELPIEAIAAQPARRGATTRRLRAGGRGRRVLVVDDEARVLALTRRVLEDAGFAVTAAASGEEALAALEAQGADLVVTDLTMPGMDGRALFAAIQARWPALAARVVVLTGNALEAQVQAFLEASGVAHLAKPYGVKELRAMVRRVAEGA